MRSGTKVTLTFSDDALLALNTMATDRKRGEFVSKLVIDAYKKGDMFGSGVLERIETKIDRMMALLADREK